MQITEKATFQWFEAFRDQGYTQAGATLLVAECKTWATNNPDMTWQDVFDAVLLAEETQGADDSENGDDSCSDASGHEWAVNEETDRQYCLYCGADGDA